ncbi:MAG TPA: hypothetical protein DCM62_04860 [Bacteroidales bacterium]|nr:hypothetical protein [Bacteroidales bacterium]
MKIIFLFFLMIVCSGTVLGQSVFLPSGSYDHLFLNRLELKAGRHSSYFHSGVKPFERRASMAFAMGVDTLLTNLTQIDRHWLHDFMQRNPEWAIEKPDSSRLPIFDSFYAFPSDLFRYQSETFFISINPVLEVSFDMERGIENLHYLNTRGAEVRGKINDRVGFYTFVSTTQGRFPDFVMRQQINHYGAFPREGWTKGFGEGGVDFFTARGYIAFQATENIGLQFGQDRNFIGHGIRSLLLSDYANNYLFLKVNTRYRWFHYQNLFAHLLDFPRRTLGLRNYDPKFLVAHQLSFQITPRFQLGFFESVTMGGSDSVNTRGFDWHYLNPVIFYRAIEHHVGDPDKITVGMNWEFLITPGLGFYGQFIADEIFVQDVRADLDSLLVRLGLRRERKFQTFASMRNQFGIQLGLKVADPFGLKNLDLQGEVNLIRPFVYQHFDVFNKGMRPGASYSHYSQPLAHPVGANLAEWAFKGRYRPFRNFEISTAVFSYTQGTDIGNVNYGGNVMRDYNLRHGMYNNFFLQGRQINVLLGEVTASYQFRPGWHIDVRFLARRQKELETGIMLFTNEMIGMGLRVNTVARRHHF